MIICYLSYIRAQEFETGSTREAAVVKDLDKFDMIFQAFEYEQSERLGQMCAQSIILFTMLISLLPSSFHLKVRIDLESYSSSLIPRKVRIATYTLYT